MTDSDINLYNELHGLTVPGLLYRRANAQPFKLALSAHSVHGYRDRLTYSQLAIRMDAMAVALKALGVLPSERVALFLTNAAVREAVLTALGCYRLGAIVTPLNARASDDELSHALHLTAPSVVVTTMNATERITRIYPAARQLIVDAPADQSRAWPDPERGLSHGSLPPLPSAEVPTVLLFTSGTTARSKAVTHCHRSQLYCGYAVGGALGLTEQDTYQGAWPIFTSSVLNMACMSAWVQGAGVVLEQVPLDNAGRLRLIESEATTVYHGVTAPLNFMIDELPKSDYDLSRVRRIGYGGATMPAEVIDKFSQRMPWADQVHIWGMTETGPSGTVLPPWFLPRKAGSIGAAMRGCAVKVVDEAGATVPSGQPGELMFSGPSMALGYYMNPEATAEAFVDGWVHTGDIAQQDEEGHLTFVDRKKDIINRGGLKISSAAVEEAIYRFGGVLEAAVVSIPHKDLGEDIAACVVAVPDQTLDMAALKVHCARLLADYETPRVWHLMDELPKNPMGKTLKRDLRDLLLKNHPLKSTR
jgi:acyl-CoA synthetase (AMP-forming)/AMP-acid ligase II